MTKIVVAFRNFAGQRWHVVKVLCYNRKVAGSIPDGVIGIFH